MFGPACEKKATYFNTRKRPSRYGAASTHLPVSKPPITNRVLVIGSYGDDRAECIGWYGTFPNIEEYDSVVIDLQSLYQSTFDDLYRSESEWSKIEDARKEIDTLLRTGREVFCITNEILIPSKRPGEPKSWPRPPPTNYDILPASPTVTKKEGTISVKRRTRERSTCSCQIFSSLRANKLFFQPRACRKGQIRHF